jgi:hypothetical protein
MWDNTIENNAGDGIYLLNASSVPCNPSPAPNPATTLFTIEDNYLENNANGFSGTYVIVEEQNICAVSQSADAQTVSLTGNTISGNAHSNAIQYVQ